MGHAARADDVEGGGRPVAAVLDVSSAKLQPGGGALAPLCFLMGVLSTLAIVSFGAQLFQGARKEAADTAGAYAAACREQPADAAPMYHSAAADRVALLAPLLSNTPISSGEAAPAAPAADVAGPAPPLGEARERLAALRLPWQPALTRQEAERGLSYFGSGKRLRAVAAKLLAGQPIKVRCSCCPRSAAAGPRRAGLLSTLWPTQPFAGVRTGRQYHQRQRRQRSLALLPLPLLPVPQRLLPTQVGCGAAGGCRTACVLCVPEGVQRGGPVLSFQNKPSVSPTHPLTPPHPTPHDAAPTSSETWASTPPTRAYLRRARSTFCRAAPTSWSPSFARTSRRMCRLVTLHGGGTSRCCASCWACRAGGCGLVGSVGGRGAVHSLGTVSPAGVGCPVWPSHGIAHRLLAPPRPHCRPAVLQLHNWAWWHHARGGGEALESGLFSETPAEAQLTTLAQYYDLPALSLRAAAFQLIRAGVPGFRVRLRGLAVASCLFGITWRVAQSHTRTPLPLSRAAGRRCDSAGHAAGRGRGAGGAAGRVGPAAVL